MVAAREGRVDPGRAARAAAAAEDDLAARPSHHDAEDGAHEHDDFESFVVRLPEIADPRRWWPGCSATAERTACCA